MTLVPHTCFCTPTSTKCVCSDSPARVTCGDTEDKGHTTWFPVISVLPQRIGLIRKKSFTVRVAILQILESVRLRIHREAVDVPASVQGQAEWGSNNLV